ncbi:hypothetical protein ACHAWF_003401 [Thalassiosira exigua]
MSRRLVLSIAASFAAAAVAFDLGHRGRGSIRPGPQRPRPAGFGRRHRPEVCGRRFFGSSDAGRRNPATTVRRASRSEEAAPSARPSPATRIAASDAKYMRLAASHARIGYGNTFPNPAVGCVLVRRGGGEDDEDDVVIGSGFHPRAGAPHAEVFALLEACGHVDDGVEAARSAMEGPLDGDEGGEEGVEDGFDSLRRRVSDLADLYKSEGSADELFGARLANLNVTAYVTLEPCCHRGRTPPCATALVAAGIDEVVVGYRDPNPRVDGGGIEVLRSGGVDVRLLSHVGTPDLDVSAEEAEAATECADLVRYFAKRISPRDGPVDDLDEVVTGKKRRALRSLAGRQKASGEIRQVEWPKNDSITDDDKADGEFAKNVPISHRFLEVVDRHLWESELVLLRLNRAVKKKKGAKILGERIASELNAHVAQAIGHTALLYRPGLPPVLDLDELANGVDGDR